MTEPDQETTLAAADRLDKSMKGLREEIAGLRTYGKRNRTMIWGVAASLALSLVLLVVVAFVAIEAADATSAANQNRQNAIATCNAGNQARAVSVQLWNYVLSASEQNAKDEGRFTPQLEKQIADFRTYITTAYAPRDCTQAGGS